MNSASLELCRELYELSGWEPTQSRSNVCLWWRNPYKITEKLGVPKYNLGYLLRKLPSYIYSEQYEQKAWLWTRKNTKDYNAWYWVNDPKYGEDITSEHGVTADTPEDATCKLAIELFKQGVLKRDA